MVEELRNCVFEEERGMEYDSYDGVDFFLRVTITYGI
jgi:hypothetical protein